tara:strand:+ start:299 stop:415 length:117 start_codon:yes stop_codon:yes gene_type:complete
VVAEAMTSDELVKKYKLEESLKENNNAITFRKFCEYYL